MPDTLVSTLYVSSFILTILYIGILSPVFAVVVFNCGFALTVLFKGTLKDVIVLFGTVFSAN